MTVWTVAQPSTVGSALFAANGAISGDANSTGTVYAIKVNAYMFDFSAGKFLEVTGDGDDSSKFLHSGVLHGRFVVKGFVTSPGGASKKIGIDSLRSSTVLNMKLFLASSDQFFDIDFMAENIRVSAATNGAAVEVTIRGIMTDQETVTNSIATARDPEAIQI